MDTWSHGLTTVKAVVMTAREKPGDNIRQKVFNFRLVSFPGSELPRFSPNVTYVKRSTSARNVGTNRKACCLQGDCPINKGIKAQKEIADLPAHVHCEKYDGMPNAKWGC